MVEARGPNAWLAAPYPPPGRNSAQVSRSTARTANPRRTAASRYHGAAGPNSWSATPAAKTPTAPSSTRASVAAPAVQRNSEGRGPTTCDISGEMLDEPRRDPATFDFD